MKNPKYVYFTVSHSDDDKDEPGMFKRFLYDVKELLPIIVISAVLLSMLSCAIGSQYFFKQTCASCRKRVTNNKGRMIEGRSLKAWVCEECTDTMIGRMLGERSNE